MKVSQYGYNIGSIGTDMINCDKLLVTRLLSSAVNISLYCSSCLNMNTKSCQSVNIIAIDCLIFQNSTQLHPKQI